MPHAADIANEIAAGIRIFKRECAVEGNRVTIPAWGLTAAALEGDEKGGQSSMISTEIQTYHPSLPGGMIRELSVGWGDSHAAAVKDVASGWDLLVFPLLMFHFETDPHSCFVQEIPLELPRDPGHPYRLFASGVFGRGFAKDEVPSQSLLWERLSELALPVLDAGVHHLRCFAGRFGDQISADVYLDGVPWAAGSERLTELATTFPLPTESNPIYSLKQHVLIRPADLPTGLQRSEMRQIEQWTVAVTDLIPAEQRELISDVLTGIYVIGRSAYRDESLWELDLQRRGMTTARISECMAFLQSAAARLFLKDKDKVTYATSYYWTNGRTRRAVRRRYDDTPFFTAAVHVMAALQNAKLAENELWTIASSSAEINGYNQAAANGSKVDLKFTYMVHHTTEDIDGEDLETQIVRDYPPKPKPAHTVMSMVEPLPLSPKRPWWKFW